MAVVVEEHDGSTTLDAVLRATGAREPCAVLDPRWPAALRDRARRNLDGAVGAGRVGAGDLVLFTSGSTGRPRGVVRSVESWRASVEPLAALAGLRRQDVVWLPGPMSSSLFLYGGWHAAQVGATPVVWCEPPPDATVLHAVPSLLVEALDAAESGALPRMRTAVVAGDVLPTPLRDRAEALGWRLVEYYGAAELSFVAWRSDGGAFRPFPGAQVDVRDAVVWVRSPYVSRGYLDPADGGPLACAADGWASVGDLGRVEAGGGLSLLGRGSAAVSTGGYTVVVEEVEAVLREVAGVGDAVVIGVPHPRLGAIMAACLVCRDGLPPSDLIAALRAAVGRLPPPARPRRWYRVDRVPRLTSAKVDRAAMLDAVTSGAATRLT